MAIPMFARATRLWASGLGNISIETIPNAGRTFRIFVGTTTDIIYIYSVYIYKEANTPYTYWRFGYILYIYMLYIQDMSISTRWSCAELLDLLDESWRYQHHRLAAGQYICGERVLIWLLVIFESYSHGEVWHILDQRTNEGIISTWLIPTSRMNLYHLGSQKCPAIVWTKIGHPKIQWLIMALNLSWHGRTQIHGMANTYRYALVSSSIHLY